MVFFTKMFGFLLNRFEKDLYTMIGHKPNWYWKIMWAFVSPLLIISLFIFYLTDYILTGTLQYQAWDATQVKEFQVWAFFFCFKLSLVPARIQASFLNKLFHKMAF